MDFRRQAQYLLYINTIFNIFQSYTKTEASVHFNQIKCIEYIRNLELRAIVIMLVNLGSRKSTTTCKCNSDNSNNVNIRKSVDSLPTNK